MSSVQDILSSVGMTQEGGSANPYYGSAGPKPGKAPSVNPIISAGKSVLNVGKFIGKEAYDLTGAHAIVNTVDQARIQANTLHASQVAQNNAKLIDQHRLQLTKDWRSGKLNTQQYQQGLKDVMKQYQDNQSTVDQAAKGMKEWKDEKADAGNALLSVGTLGAGVLAKGALAGAVGGAKLAEAAKAGSTAAKVASPVVNGTAKAVEGFVGAGRTGGAVSQVLKAGAHTALVTRPTIQAVQGTAHDVQTGNTGGLAGDAAVLAAPAILKGVGMTAAGLGKGLMGVKNFASEISVKDGESLWHVVQAMPEGAAKNDAMKTLKVMSQYNLDQMHGNLGDAVDNFAAHYANGTQSRTAGELIKEFRDMQQGVKAVRAAGKNGNLIMGTDAQGNPIKTPENANLWVGRWDQTAKKAAIERLATAESPLDRLNMVKDMVKTGEIPHNQILIDEINKAVFEGGENWQKELNAVTGTRGLATADGKPLKLPKDYVPIIRNQGAEFKAARDIADLPTPVRANPFLGKIAQGMERMGVGITPQNGKAFRNIFDNVTGKLDELNLSSSNPELTGAKIYAKLQDRAEQLHLTDVRQLRVGEIEQALSVGSNTNARAIQKAIREGFKATGIKDGRSLADHLMDYNMRYNPAAPGYSRIQNAMRYKTPWFKAQQVVEANALGQIVAPGRLRSANELAQVKQIMRDQGVFLEASRENSLRDTVGGGIRQHLMPKEENALARAAAQLAENRGVSVDELLQDRAVRETIKSIVAYPSTGALSSNLARTANMAIFPLRYNAKVTALVGKALASQPAAVQIGVVKGLSDFHHWLDTPDGKKWQADNSEAIGLFSYYTPVNSITSFAHFLGSGSIRDLGTIGGLPFGAISMVLQGQGIMKQPPYVDPKTGEIVPDLVPQTAKARAQQAARDILGTFFSFPGRQAGFAMSKNQLMDAVPGLKRGAGYTKDTSGQLTADQLKTQQALKGAAATKAQRIELKDTTSVENVQSKAIPVPAAAKTKTAKAKKPKARAVVPSSSVLGK